MNQPTHAWLAVEAYRKIAAVSKTPEGKNKKLERLAKLLGDNLQDVVVAAWLPDSLIKDMVYGHIFKNSVYEGDQQDRFKLSKEDLTKKLVDGTQIPAVAFEYVLKSWWDKAYRVKDKGGHLPARVTALCQTARDMLRMGDADVVALTGVTPAGAVIIDDSLLYSPRNVAMTLWMASHYIADSHMPFHCDNRLLASSSNKKKAHGDIEVRWGEQVSEMFHSKTILSKSTAEILAAQLPSGSKFSGLNFGNTINLLKNNGDPWEEAVYICRASFAASFALVPEEIAKVDDKTTEVSLDDILTKSYCGEDRFWKISRAVMTDAVNSIAMFWQDVWVDYVGKKEM